MWLNQISALILTIVLCFAFMKFELHNLYILMFNCIYFLKIGSALNISRIFLLLNIVGELAFKFYMFYLFSFTYWPQFPFPPLLTIPLTICHPPQSTLPLFLPRKVQVSHRYSQSTVYQVAVKWNTSPWLCKVIQHEE